MSKSSTSDYTVETLPWDLPIKINSILLNHFGVLENKNTKIILEFKIQADHLIQITRIDLYIMNKTGISWVWWNKMGYLLRYGWIYTTVWMYHMDPKKMHWEKGRWELH